MVQTGQSNNPSRIPSFSLGLCFPWLFSFSPVPIHLGFIAPISSQVSITRRVTSVLGSGTYVPRSGLGFLPSFAFFWFFLPLRRLLPLRLLLPLRMLSLSLWTYLVCQHSLRCEEKGPVSSARIPTLLCSRKYLHIPPSGYPRTRASLFRKRKRTSLVSASLWPSLVAAS